MSKSQRRAGQLGMSHGAATSKLRKMVIYSLIRKLDQHYCFKCGSEIESADDMTIEHILPWENIDASRFWDIDNIAFSHAECNRPDKMRVPTRLVTTDNKLRCSNCKTYYDTSFFHKSSNKPSGYHSHCKTCRSQKDTRRNHRRQAIS